MSKKLNTTHPEQLIYENEAVKIQIMGGIRLDRLDTLRATLKIEYGHQAMRHNLDLYNDTQVNKLIRRTAGKLQLGMGNLTDILEELTDLLETYRMEQLEAQNPQKVTKVELTKKEIEQAQKFLKSSNLLELTNQSIGKAGVIGEVDNRLLMFLIFSSRKQKRPLHIISMGRSGSGKSHLQESVAGLMPQEDCLEITDLSENAFYYFDQYELSNKLILIEDLDGAETAFYPLRELQSKRRISKTVVKKDGKGKTKTMQLVVEGPVCVAGCTTKESIYEDNANRSFLIHINDSKEQDLEIMAYQRALSAGNIDTDEQEATRKLLQNTQRILQPIKVINPFAELLKLPQEVFKPRRTNTHYLDFIETVTFYHQYQRTEQVNKETGEVFIETTIEDIKLANELMKEVLLRKSDELSSVCRSYFEQLKQYLNTELKNKYKVREITDRLHIPLSSVKRYQAELMAYSYIIQSGGNRKKGFEYQINIKDSYQELKKKVALVLDHTLEQITKKSATTPKAKKTTNKKEVAQ